VSKVVNPSAGRPPITGAPKGDVVTAAQAGSAHETTSLRTASLRWRLAKIQGTRGLLRLRSVKTSSWVTIAGMCLVVWALALNVWPKSNTDIQGDGIDHLAAGAELGAVKLGAADTAIQQIEFLSDGSASPDAAFLPLDIDAPSSGPAIPGGAAGDHDSPAWLLGTIEDEPTQRADTPSR
jgi:hypothetical protein